MDAVPLCRPTRRPSLPWNRRSSSLRARVSLANLWPALEQIHANSCSQVTCERESLSVETALVPFPVREFRARKSMRIGHLHHGVLRLGCSASMPSNQETKFALESPELQPPRPRLTREPLASTGTDSCKLMFSSDLRARKSLSGNGTSQHHGQCQSPEEPGDSRKC